MIRLLTEILALGVLLGMLRQDWRWRGITWYLFPLLAALLLISRLTELRIAEMLPQVGLNLLLVAMQVLLLVLYVRLRFRAPLTTYLGSGDILYWVVCTIYFPPLLYLTYHVISLLAALFFFLIWQHLSNRPMSERIPLAGLQAMILALVLLASWVFPAVLPRDDSALLAYLT